MVILEEIFGRLVQRLKIIISQLGFGDADKCPFLGIYLAKINCTDKCKTLCRHQVIRNKNTICRRDFKSKEFR